MLKNDPECPDGAEYVLYTYNDGKYKAISLTGWQAGIFTNHTNQNAIIEHIDTSRITKELSFTSNIESLIKSLYLPSSK